MTGTESLETGPWAGRPLKSSRVFHYTSAVGLHGMLTSGTIWATEAAGLNDRREVTEGWDYVRKHIERMHPRTEFVTWLHQLLDGPPTGRDLSDPGAVFVLSASRAGDDANQWRLYGDQGRGYVVEFDTTPRFRVATQCGRHQDRTSLDTRPRRIDFGVLMDVAVVSGWSRVVYRPRHRLELMEQVLTRAEARWRWGETATSDPDDGPSAWELAMQEGAALLNTAAQTIKGPGFAGEREARVFVTFELGDRHANFRAGAAGLVRHIALTTSASANGEIAFGTTAEARSDWRLPIRSIRLGPALDPCLGKSAVRSLLRRHGYGPDEVPVKHSRVPLR